MTGTSDTILKGSRWPPIIFGAVCQPSPSSLLLLWSTLEREMLIKADHKYHLLCLVGYLEHSYRLEMGLLYSFRGRVWT